MKIASAFAGAARAAAFCVTLALHCARLLVMTPGVTFLWACALINALRTREAAIVARIAVVAAVATAALLAVAGPSYADAAAVDCLPLGGEALLPVPAWLPTPLQPFWTAIVTVPVAGWIMAHMRPWLPNDPRISIVLGVLDKIAGNYGQARNAA